jgi:transcriptional regulator with XRE-family HTH domain
MYDMQRYAAGMTNEVKQRLRASLARRSPPDKTRPPTHRTWEYSRQREHPNPGDTYRDAVATPEVNRARFAAFVARTLARARDNGMRDKDITAKTGVPPSTFHRWQKGQFVTAPSLDRVRQFCEGLGVDPQGAMVALGFTPGRDDTAPEPPLPRDVRTILRRLADPNTPEPERDFIRKTLEMLSARVAADERAERTREAG